MNAEGRITGIYGAFAIRESGDLIKGNGKTMTAVYYLYLDYLRGYKCYANIGTSFTESMNTADVYKLFKDSTARDISILLDELQKDMNSTAGFTSPKTIVEFANIAAAQTRKRNINLYWTAQMARDVHLRVRNQTDYLLQPIRVHATKEPEERSDRCTKAACTRPHYIRVYSMEPARQNPLVTLDCCAVGSLYDTSQVLTDKMVPDEVEHA